MESGVSSAVDILRFWCVRGLKIVCFSFFSPFFRKFDLFCIRKNTPQWPEVYSWLCGVVLYDIIAGYLNMLLSNKYHGIRVLPVV